MTIEIAEPRDDEGWRRLLGCVGRVNAGWFLDEPPGTLLVLGAQRLRVGGRVRVVLERIGCLYGAADFSVMVELNELSP